MARYFVAGGAGFIGSHLVQQLLEEQDVTVTIFDNFSSGREWHLGSAWQQPACAGCTWRH